ncbi:YgfZ/GcvT domain-containing protein [Cumulibacter soli]|uniref:CAF17-like 4Fe-4S cluster assembly/insertion protein YgfZ n=1 Tax=Cumulibacter soli TaxID=2546344 RepID=UPI0010679B35|nr:glycine cleavage T C-terminal barrel domain-containing protein [Cumulibacter soli]
MTTLANYPGRVPGEGLDSGVAAHYGDPLREQRYLARSAAVIDRSDRGLVIVRGADRLSWLHSLSTQHLEQMPESSAIQGLILSPHGHVEHDLWFTSTGEEVWIDCEPGDAPALADYLTKMQFMLRVEVEDASDSFSMATLIGPKARDVVAAVLGASPPDPGMVAYGEGVMMRALPYPGEFDLLGTPAHVNAAVAAALEAGAQPAGAMAYDAWRVENLRPRQRRETDHRTIPHEVGLIGDAVHLNKGCYRGQETVARVQNLGRPPRRLVKLQVDGSQHTVPSPGAKVLSEGREVGFVGTAVMHHEEGPIALAVIKRNLADGADVIVVDDDVEYAALIDTGLTV